MSEPNEGGSFAAASSGKSQEEIAFELVNKLKGQGVWGERNLAPILDMYAECLDAVKGLRPYEGQNRVETPVKRPGLISAAAQREPAPAPSLQQPAAQAAPAQQAQAHQPQAQPQPMPAVQSQQPTVQAQQQALQQAYRQG